MAGKSIEDPVALTIRWVRKAYRKGLSIRKIAEIVDMAPSTVHRWLDGPISVKDRKKRGFRCPHGRTSERIWSKVKNIKVQGVRAKAWEVNADGTKAED